MSLPTKNLTNVHYIVTAHFCIWTRHPTWSQHGSSRHSSTEDTLGDVLPIFKPGLMVNSRSIPRIPWTSHVLTYQNPIEIPGDLKRPLTTTLCWKQSGRRPSTAWGPMGPVAAWKFGDFILSFQVLRCFKPLNEGNFGVCCILTLLTTWKSMTMIESQSWNREWIDFGPETRKETNINQAVAQQRLPLPQLSSSIWKLAKPSSSPTSKKYPFEGKRGADLRYKIYHQSEWLWRRVNLQPVGKNWPADWKRTPMSPTSNNHNGFIKCRITWTFNCPNLWLLAVNKHWIDLFIGRDMGVSNTGGTPKWMVSKATSHLLMDDESGYPHLWNPHMFALASVTSFAQLLPACERGTHQQLPHGPTGV